MSLKFLILLFYYNRPTLVKNALQSLKESTYQNFEVAFIDDGSEVSGECTTREYLKDSPELLSRFSFINTFDTKEAKLARGGSCFGKAANKAIEESNADIVIMLCDDDGFTFDYLEKTAKFFEENPAVDYAYTHLILFNPLEEDFNVVKNRTEASNYLNWTHPINPVCQVDSSQVCWRTKCSKEGNCWFAYPLTCNLDANLYAQLFEKYGNCVWTGNVGILKGWMSKQLGKRTNWYEEAE